MPFAGTEGYNPAPYLPYILVAGLADAIGLEFPAGLLMMRILGVIESGAADPVPARVRPQETSRAAVTCCSAIEIELSGARIRVEPGVDATTLATVLSALRGGW
jgi:hypothetical protein